MACPQLRPSENILAGKIHDLEFRMYKLCQRSLIIWIVLALVVACAVAKRMPPKPVAPVVANGVRYSAEGDGRNGYVVAADAASGNILWKVKVFHNPIKFWVEEDVQWVYITNLRLVEQSLFIRDESARCYSIDLKTKHVRNQACPQFFSS